ncbi:MAG: diacylglycerol/lipid kinase family protein [Myxococcota bacterium]
MDHGARNEGERITVVANPRAGGGRAGEKKDEIARALDRAFARAKIVWTEGPGHASELARAAAAESDIVAALGGDGTCSEVVNGFFRDGKAVSPRVVFTALPFGTGGDLVRSLEIPGALDRALWIAATGTTVPLDVGQLRWSDRDARVFVNVAGVGANAEVCRRANASSKRFGGRVTFLGATLATVATFRPRPVRWRWRGPDGDGEEERETLAGFVANGHYCGAGLWVGKGGSMADGFFDLTMLPGFPARELPLYLRRIYDGGLGSISGVRRLRVTSVEVASEIPIEADGEPLGDGPIAMSVLPRALHVRGGWLRPPHADL